MTQIRNRFQKKEMTNFWKRNKITIQSSLGTTFWTKSPQFFVHILMFIRTMYSINIFFSIFNTINFIRLLISIIPRILKMQCMIFFIFLNDY